MPSNRQARINRLKAAFQKAEQLMNDGYIVQWDGEVVTKIDWVDGITCCVCGNGGCVIYSESDDVWNTYLDMTIAEINKELAERLIVWKQVEVKL